MVTTTAREENGEFCVAVAPATRTAGYWPSWLKALAVKLSRPSGWSGSYTGIIGFNPRQLKGLKGDELPHNGPSVYAKSSLQLDVVGTVLQLYQLFLILTFTADYSSLNCFFCTWTWKCFKLFTYREHALVARLMAWCRYCTWQLVQCGSLSGRRLRNTVIRYTSSSVLLPLQVYTLLILSLTTRTWESTVNLLTKSPKLRNMYITSGHWLLHWHFPLKWATFEVTSCN